MGVTLFDAPVLGTKQPAEQGKLVILASGPDDDGGARAAVQPIFDAVGQKTMWLGAVGEGTRLKLVANAWVLTVVEGGAETIAFAEGLGLDPSLLFEAIEGGALDLPYLRLKGKAIAERNFEPSFRLTLAAKDARLIEESAQRRELDVPLFSTIRRRLAEGAKDHGDEDMSATYWTSAPGSDPQLIARDRRARGRPRPAPRANRRFSRRRRPRSGRSAAAPVRPPWSARAGGRPPQRVDAL